MVNRYIDQGVAELVPGVLFIDEVRSRADVARQLAHRTAHAGCEQPRRTPSQFKSSACCPVRHGGALVGPCSGRPPRPAPAHPTDAA